MKQVTREDFEVLSKYHPTEIRYFADTGVEINKRKPVRVIVRRPPASTNGAKSPQAGIPKNRHVQLTTKGAGNMSPSTLKYKVFTATCRIMQKDPTKVMTRPELTDALVKALPNLDKKSNIVPSVSSLIKSGNLRYVGEEASS